MVMLSMSHSCLDIILPQNIYELLSSDLWGHTGLFQLFYLYLLGKKMDVV